MPRLLLKLLSSCIFFSRDKRESKGSPPDTPRSTIEGTPINEGQSTIGGGIIERYNSPFQDVPCKSEMLENFQTFVRESEITSEIDSTPDPSTQNVLASRVILAYWAKALTDKFLFLRGETPNWTNS